MFETIEPQIEAAEALLRQAMLDCDIDTLDALIAPNLIFTTHYGLVISKQDDLEAYRSGKLIFHKIELSERKILMLTDVVLVSVRAKVSGIFGDASFHDDIRFSRLWQRSSIDSWQIIAGQATSIQA